MRKIAIITARGGSKRIPKKNIKQFCGLPLIAYSIQAARKCGLFDVVMVSTDSQEIAKVAESYGAAVPFFRTKENSNDYATTADVLEEVLNTYKQQGENFDIMCCIYPTAPFVTAEKLQQAYKVFEKADTSMLMPVVAFSFPPQRSMVLRGGTLVYVQPEHARTRSQDLEPWYHDAGQFYFYKTGDFLKALAENGKAGGYSLSCTPFVLNDTEVQDIDTIDDLEIAAMKYRLMTK